MKTILLVSYLLSSVSVMAGGTRCRALCETPWSVKTLEAKGGETYFAPGDVFAMLRGKCRGELVSGYQRDPYEPWLNRPILSTVVRSCQFDESIPSNYAPEYSGTGVGH